MNKNANEFVINGPVGKEAVATASPSTATLPSFTDEFSNIDKLADSLDAIGYTVEAATLRRAANNVTLGHRLSESETELRDLSDSLDAAGFTLEAEQVAHFRLHVTKMVAQDAATGNGF